jgi:hypothetical protein
LSNPPRICRNGLGFVEFTTDLSNPGRIRQDRREFGEFRADSSRTRWICQNQFGFVESAADLSKPAWIRQIRRGFVEIAAILPDSRRAGRFSGGRGGILPGLSISSDSAPLIFRLLMQGPIGTMQRRWTPDRPAL